MLGAITARLSSPATQQSAGRAGKRGQPCCTQSRTVFCKRPMGGGSQLELSGPPRSALSGYGNQEPWGVPLIPNELPIGHTRELPAM